MASSHSIVSSSATVCRIPARPRRLGSSISSPSAPYARRRHRHGIRNPANGGGRPHPALFVRPPGRGGRCDFAAPQAFWQASKRAPKPSTVGREDTNAFPSNLVSKVFRQAFSPVYRYLLGSQRRAFALTQVKSRDILRCGSYAGREAPLSAYSGEGARVRGVESGENQCSSRKRCTRC